METRRLGDYILSNPSVKLKKGERYQLTDIDSITIGQKYPVSKGLVVFEGQSGSRFSKGDTIMARITPCLENGKIAMYNGEEDSIGSTELFVFRGKEGISTNEFVYYFFKQNWIRNYAANSMTGASGRQRADIKFIQKAKVEFPPLPTQQKIASILSAYDSQIENNRKRIKLLEQMAENLYKEWFVRFRFPSYESAEFEGGVPKGWKYETLGDYADVIMGQSPESCFYNSEKQGLPFHQGCGSYGDFYLQDDIYSTEGKRLAESNSIIFSVRAPVGRINITLNKIILGRGVAGINAKNGNNAFLLWLLKNKFSKEDIIGNGSIFTSVTKDELLGQKLLIPSKEIEDKFNSIASNIEMEMRQLTKGKENLTRQRDLLLPRLMSGKLEVKGE